VRLTAAGVVLSQSVEDTLRIMTGAGFDDEMAARSLAALSALAAATARERLVAARPTGPQVPELRSALEAGPGEALTTLRRLAEADLASFNDEQLQMSIDF
jgi:hypothetical protein